jgi:hypothetical protein
MITFHFAEGRQIKSLTLSSSATTLETPEPFTALAASENGLAGAFEGSIWISTAGSGFVKTQLPAAVTSLSSGEGKTLWFTGNSMDPDASPVVAQSNFEGGILRALVPGPTDPRPVRVRASRLSDVFGVLEESPGLQRLRVLSRNPEAGWTIEWERFIQDAPAFGFLNGEVQADFSSETAPVIPVAT